MRSTEVIRWTQRPPSTPREHTSCLLPLGAHLAGLGSVPDRRCSSVPRRFPRSRAHPGALRAEDPLRRHGGGRRGDRVGQTLSYVVPVVDTVVRLAGPQPAAAVDKRNHDPFSHGPKALILLPTGILCDQVIGVIHSLAGDAGAPLVEAAKLSSASIPGYVPDVLVTTPAALLSFWRNVSVGYPRGWMSRENLLASVRIVVLDEADLVLTASARASEQVLEMLRLDDRRRTARMCQAQMGIGPDEWEAISSHKRQVAYDEGVAAFLELMERPGRPQAESEPFYWSRQYVFVGATIPDTGAKGVASSIMERAPHAAWIEGQELHQSKRVVAHSFVRVTDDTWAEELVRAVRGDATRGRNAKAGRAGGAVGSGDRDGDREGAATGGDGAGGTGAGEEGGGRTMVFAKSKGGADEAAMVLARAGCDVLLYHNGLPVEERDSALRAFRGTPGSLLVCTDSASRGLDIPGVDHVVQADFASTAVDFLHRTGRTARADRPGRVTSLYTDADAALAGAIRDAVAAHKPVEACFSRNRSFRKKVKRRGEDYIKERIHMSKRIAGIVAASSLAGSVLKSPCNVSHPFLALPGPLLANRRTCRAGH